MKSSAGKCLISIISGAEMQLRTFNHSNSPKTALALLFRWRQSLSFFVIFKYVISISKITMSIPMAFFVVASLVSFFTNISKEFILKITEKLKQFNPKQKAITAVGVLVAFFILLFLSKAPLVGKIFWHTASGFFAGYFFKNYLEQRKQRRLEAKEKKQENQ